MKIKLFSILMLLLMPGVMAFELEDLEDIEVFGLEVEKLLYFFSALLATGLSVVSFTAMKRNGKQNLGYVGTAFGFYALKGFLLSAELFIEELSFVDPVSAALDFAIMLFFFLGVLKR